MKENSVWSLIQSMECWKCTEVVLCLEYYITAKNTNEKSKHTKENMAQHNKTRLLNISGVTMKR